LRNLCLKVLWLLLIIIQFGKSQIDSLSTVPDKVSGSTEFKNDSLITKSSTKSESTDFHPTKSPMLALGLSAVLPGTGQIYTGNYFKTVLIWGVGGYWIYEWIQLNNKYQDFRSRYKQTLNEQYLRLRDFYRDERDKFAWFLGALYVLNLVDAYAGAHLYDFDVSPELTLDGRIVPKATVMFKIKLY